ncbi:phosphotransferase enzyme family-domain-containing protein [Pseudoneurospora amorphoporcata]|uniref:Phosphotransferase enzyme family-domain-containing protein n=1 Tax=Pseudoneurospora amorphoporcata TaxID=241081 RepID=A0AAN6NK41_9PEZI|nr:phosphotransferase enzyme family-domain-containing protein [Pseudoneurospora amorphoporcata]
MAGRMRYQVRRLALPSSSTKHAHSGCEARTYTCTATTSYTDADYGYGWYQFGRMPPQMVQPQFITLRTGSAKSSVVSNASSSATRDAKPTLKEAAAATTTSTPSSIRDSSRSGLFWDSTGLDIEPRWARQPDIDAIAQVVRRHLGITSPSQCVVTFHSSGTYNKLYHVYSPVHGRYLMRVILPVDPHNKTRGEVATLQLVRRKTDIPVPVVVAYDDTSDNEIGFEWILMELLEGKPAHLGWRKMNMRQKERLVGMMAEFQAQLSRCGNMTESGFRGIGTLGATSRGESDYVDLMMPEPGPMVSPVFFTGERWYYPVSRGPFQSSHDWLRSYLNIVIKEHSATLSQSQPRTPDDDTDREKRELAEGVTRVARKLTRLLHKIFPQLVHPSERTVLWHGDSLSLDNLLVDENGRITGVVDWECVSTMPRWVSTQFPEFLRGEVDREEEPHRSRYADVFSDEDVLGDEQDGGMEDAPDNEGKTELYWIHLMEYEQTQLRRVYSAKMNQLMGNGWDGEVQEAALKVDFLGAVSKCAQGLYLKRIEQWVDAVEAKEFVRLGDVLRGNVAGRKDSNASTTSAAGVSTGTGTTDTRTIRTTATLSPKRGSENQRPRFSITKIY